MSILAECPLCHRKQSVSNRLCSCGVDLAQQKRAKRVKYWITYRLPGGKQRRESVGYSIEEAKDADGKRRSQKREGRIFDMLPESKTTFQELTDWYLDLTPVKRLKSLPRIKGYLRNFNERYGQMLIGDIKLTHLEDYQTRREDQGRTPATIDMELSIVRSMVSKGFYNDLVSGDIVKTFQRVHKRLRKGGNVRTRILSIDEYVRLINVSPQHLRDVLIVAYNTGMRLGEVRGLQWKHIDRERMFIRLPADATKEGKTKNIPINYHVKAVLDSLHHAIKHDFVFMYHGQPIRGDGGLRRSFSTACRKAGIHYGRDVPGGIIFHDIRGTVKTNMLEAGVDKVYRDCILGHSLQGMDAHYLAPTEEALSDAMGKYTLWIDNKLQSVDQNVDQNEKRG